MAPTVIEVPSVPSRTKILAHVAPDVVIARVEPHYPPIARKAGVSGDVILDLTLTADGTVCRVGVQRGVPLLDRAAEIAAQEWVFA